MMSGPSAPVAVAGAGGYPSTGALFSVQLRASCCFQCATPCSGPDGGRVHCTQCGQPIDLKPRSSFARPGNPPPPGAQDPALRAQDGRPLVPPANIVFLWEGGDIPAHRQPEALAAWQGARRRALAMDVGAGEEICMLTRVLASKAEAAGDWVRMRALIEAGLECAAVPRQRAILLGMMARAAVRAGDVQAAGSWLSCFEPPQDLESESEYRVSTAVVATARGDFMAVLSAVGSAFDQVAIQDALDHQAAMFRINALERLGRPEAAQQLTALLAQGPSSRNAIEGIQRQYQRLGLCQTTLPSVQQAHEQKARAGAGLGKIGLGCLLMGVSVLPFVIISIVAVVTYFSEGSYEAFIGVPFSFIFVLGFGLWGFRTFRVGQRERQVFASGVRAAARVVGASPTGVRINNVPEMRVELDVQLQPPVRTAIRMLVSPGEHHLLRPGTMLHVRVDPRNPDVAVLDQ